MRNLVLCLAVVIAQPAIADSLRSWIDEAAKSRIVAFVETLSDPASPDFVPEARRIATFDNDVTLWAEQPVYLQLFFAMDCLAERAKSDPV